jgi:hypothetical protein
MPRQTAFFEKSRKKGSPIGDTVTIEHLRGFRRSHIGDILQKRGEFSGNLSPIKTRVSVTCHRVTDNFRGFPHFLEKYSCRPSGERRAGRRRQASPLAERL